MNNAFSCDYNNNFYKPWPLDYVSTRFGHENGSTWVGRKVFVICRNSIHHSSSLMWQSLGAEVILYHASEMGTRGYDGGSHLPPKKPGQFIRNFRINVESCTKFDRIFFRLAHVSTKKPLSLSSSFFDSQSTIHHMVHIRLVAAFSFQPINMTWQYGYWKWVSRTFWEIVIRERHGGDDRKCTFVVVHVPSVMLLIQFYSCPTSGEILLLCLVSRQ
jgi:hypothetical protein